MMTIEPGSLRHQVDIYRPSASIGSRGQRTGSPTLLLAEVPCSIETLSGLEMIRAQKQFADATHRVHLHADPDTPLTPRDYLLFGTRTLNIGAIEDVDQIGVECVLLCKEDI